MSNVTADIKKLFNFKYKTRNDSISDQYNRLFMVKAMLVAAFLTGMNWYKDEIKCIIPKHFDSSSMGSYGAKACWINGFYVYEQLRHKENFHGYFGMPTDLKHNGTNDYDETCEATIENKGCEPMKKKFFLQYQWFPFYLAAIAVLYYAPYILFGFVNNDLKTLKDSIKSQKVNIDDIVSSYFTSKHGTISKNRRNFRVGLNVLVKIAYLIVNVLALTMTDSLLNGEFKNFGQNWLDWSNLDNTKAHNYMGARDVRKPGEVLLPTFGFCDVLELGKDIKHDLINEYQLVCEISQHILYHYVLIALWFLIVFGLLFSVIGILELLARYCLRSSLFGKDEIAARRVFHTLSIREQEYLDFIRKKNVCIYGELIRKLHQEKFGDNDGYSSDAGLSSRGMDDARM